jgi:hypothetical protein
MPNSYCNAFRFAVVLFLAVALLGMSTLAAKSMEVSRIPVVPGLKSDMATWVHDPLHRDPLPLVEEPKKQNTKEWDPGDALRDAMREESKKDPQLLDEPERKDRVDPCPPPTPDPTLKQCGHILPESSVVLNSGWSETTVDDYIFLLGKYPHPSEFKRYAFRIQTTSGCSNFPRTSYIIEIYLVNHDSYVRRQSYSVP